MPPFALTFDLARLLAPLALVIFSLLADIGTRLMLPGLRDWVEPLLGLPQNGWRWLHRKLARATRTSVELQKRGVLALLVVVACGALVAIGGDRLAHVHRYAAYGVWFGVWHWSVGWTLARDVLLLPTPTVTAYRIVAQRRLGPDAHGAVPDVADAATLYRQTIVTIATGLVGGLAAPLCYALLFAALGWPAFYGAVLGVMADLLKTPVQSAATRRLFDRPANALAQMLLFVPGRLAALVMLIATLFTPRAKTLAALKLVLRQGHVWPDPSAGWVLAIVSGAFGVALPRGVNAAGQGQWLGDTTATAQIAKGAVQQTVWLHAVTVLLTLLILCAGLLLSM